MPIFHQTLWRNIHVWRREKLEPFPLHFHDYIEILYIKEGSTVCTVNFTEYPLSKGDVLLVFPEQIHSVVSASDDSENLVIFFPKELPVFGSIFESQLPQSAVVNIPNAGILFEECLKSYNNRKNEYAKGEALGHILILLSALLQNVTLKSGSEADNRLERRIIEYCTEHFAEPLTLAKASAEFGYTSSYFSDVFAKKFNGGFSKFINTLRVEEAKKRLCGEEEISSIAFSCGFGSIRTFNRVFKEQTDSTPREYRNLHIQNKSV